MSKSKVREVLKSKAVKTKAGNRLDCEWVKHPVTGESFRCYEGDKFIWAKRIGKGEKPTEEDFTAFLELTKESK